MLYLLQKGYKYITQNKQLLGVWGKTRKLPFVPESGYGKDFQNTDFIHSDFVIVLEINFNADDFIHSDFVIVLEINFNADKSWRIYSDENWRFWCHKDTKI